MTNVLETSDIMKSSYINYTTNVKGRIESVEGNNVPIFTFTMTEDIKIACEEYQVNFDSKLPLRVDRKRFNNIVNDHINMIRNTKTI